MRMTASLLRSQTQTQTMSNRLPAALKRHLSLHLPTNSNKAERITSIFLFYFPLSPCSTFSADTAALPSSHLETNSTHNNHCDSFGLGAPKNPNPNPLHPTKYLLLWQCFEGAHLLLCFLIHTASSFFLAAMQQNHIFLGFFFGHRIPQFSI